jgi:predicted acetyltransferase
VDYCLAEEADLDQLAEWNHQLIRDEGHRNPMTVAELRERMRGWLAGEYTAIIFEVDAEPVAYALYRDELSQVYLRHFFVRRDRRRQGLGRQAIDMLRRLWSPDKRLIVEVLTANRPGLAFWRAVGYQDYCLTLEILPEQECDPHP